MEEKTCIIIPCYNEADRFKREQYLSFLQQVPDIDICFVNDGSSDATLQ
ncbi:MAG: glycosyltransferase, partial [Odoribacter sp.]|nr:glycosyltransferase [Odoribacter sp.]